MLESPKQPEALRWSVMAPRRISGFATGLGLSALALCVALVAASVRLHRLGARVEELERDVSALQQEFVSRSALSGEPISPLLLSYALELPGRGEVFPAMAAARAPEYWPVALLRVSNSADRPVAQTIAAEIPGWSRRTEQSLVLRPHETRSIRVQPELLGAAYANDEIRRATLEVRAIGPEGATFFVESRTVLIHAGSEIYWGRRFANAQVAARWVTPHDPSVLRLVSEARRYVARGRMAGYNGNGDAAAVERQVRAQAKAVYRALQRSGISYVNSLFVMGDYVNEAQRIRLPGETLRLASANCMDVSVVFASAMENLGMQPYVVIVPGHAFAGVRLARDSARVLYLDLTVLPNGSFESAAARAERFLHQTPGEQILIVDVAAARALGVYPISERTTT